MLAPCIRSTLPGPSKTRVLLVLLIIPLNSRVPPALSSVPSAPALMVVPWLIAPAGVRTPSASRVHSPEQQIVPPAASAEMIPWLTTVTSLAPPEQIGRASCRERAYIAVPGATVKKKPLPAGRSALHTEGELPKRIVPLPERLGVPWKIIRPTVV